jgi:uncharacterized protein (DUF427 family)
MQTIPFELVRPTNYYFRVDAVWEKSLNQTVKFNCGDWRSYPIQPMDIIYCSAYLKSASLAFVRMEGGGIYCVRGGLFRFLNSSFSGAFTFMRLFGVDGKANPDWRTIWNSKLAKEVIIRGSQGSTVKYCRKCGHLLYYPVPPYNVVAESFEFGDVQVAQNGLLVRSSVANSLRELRLKGVEYAPVNVVKMPVDGFSLDFKPLTSEGPNQ